MNLNTTLAVNVADTALVLFASEDTRIHCAFRQNGSILWTVNSRGAVRAAVAVTRNWQRRPVGGFPQAVTGSHWQGDLALVGSADGSMYAISIRTGAIVWTLPTSDWVVSSVVFSSDWERLYFGGYDAYVYCLSTRTGTVRNFDPTLIAQTRMYTNLNTASTRAIMGTNLMYDLEARGLCMYATRLRMRVPA